MQFTAPSLCEGVFGVHSGVCPSRPLLPGRLLLNSRHCSANLSERQRRQRCHVRTNEIFRGKSVEASTSAAHDKFVSYGWNKCSSNVSGLNGGPHSVVVDKADSRTTETSADFFFNTVKFLALLGFLSLQGSHQAVAGTTSVTGTQLLSSLGELGDISSGFASAFLLIFFSELGDKTFFIAALLAAQSSGGVVFVGTFGALVAMTLVSVVLGRTFHYVDGILPFKFGTDLPVDDIAAVCLLVYFGVTTLIDAASSDSSITEEEKKEAELAISELSGDGSGMVAATSTIVSTFLLVFVAEWGDKSFFSTIALAAAASPFGVIAGAMAGHAVATTLAVVGGSLLGSFFSEKVISYIGGTLFLVFAVVTIIEIVN